jgi:lysophospholipase L1-like esterase
MTRLQFALRLGLWAVIAVITMEVCARVDDYVSHKAPLLEPYNIGRIYEFDDLGARGKPGATYLKWKLNNLGFRGPDLKQGGLRVVCLGSSETFGLYESEGGEYPRQLERELNRNLGTDQVQVINIAYPGMSLSASLRRLPQVLSTVQPRYATIYPSLAAYIDLGALQPPKPGFRPPPPSPWEPRLKSRIETMVKQMLPESLQTRVRAWQIERAERNAPVMDRLPEENVARFKEDVLRTVRTMQEHGVTPILMTHATLFGNSVDEDERPVLIAWRKFYPNLREDGFLDMERRMNDVIRQVAEEQNVPLLDLAQKMPSGRTYFVEFVHFTDQGAARMGKLIADFLSPMIRQRVASNTTPPDDVNQRQRSMEESRPSRLSYNPGTPRTKALSH